MEFNSIKDELNHSPSRVELYLQMDEYVYSAMRKNSKLNLFRDYLTFLSDNEEITSEEKTYINTKSP